MTAQTRTKVTEDIQKSIEAMRKSCPLLTPDGKALGPRTLRLVKVKRSIERTYERR